jgi:HEAT repeat protein
VDAEPARASLISRLAGPGADPSIGVRAAVADLLSAASGDAGKRALVEALSDPEAAVRRPAIAALRRITGTNEGFEPDDPPERRAAAIAAWKRRLASGR